MDADRSQIGESVKDVIPQSVDLPDTVEAINADDNERAVTAGIDQEKLSKNQSKKRKKLEQMQQMKALKKQKRKESKEVDASHDSQEGRDADNIPLKEDQETMCTDNDEISRRDVVRHTVSAAEGGIETNRNRKEEKLRQFMTLCSSNFKVILDCSFEHLHLEGPLKSLCQQIMFCYGYNKSHTNPVKLYVTGIGERCKSQLTKSSYKSWAGIEFFYEDFPLIPMFQSNPSKDDEQAKDVVLASQNKLKFDDNIIYLSSDAAETLETLNSDHTYIIGGIVDRNKYKGITYQKALSLGIRTAKLPIKEHLKLLGSHILTINHVFEILLNFSKTKSWAESLESVLPQRKKEGANDDDELKEK